MARKNLLSDLTAVKTTDDGEDGPGDRVADETAASAPRRMGGAIGAVGRSFAQMRANSVVDVPADMIDRAGLEDRLSADAGHAELVASLREYGQQVPVLLRHSPNHQGRYEVIYGRRRVAALRELRQPVRAIVRDLPDRDLVMAQGQENAARRDLSFIEKAHFARQMQDMGFERRDIQGALHQAEAVVSKMLSVAEKVSEEVIRAIGAAPRIGRERWVAFSRMVPGREDEAVAATRDIADSDTRFEAAQRALRPRARPATPAPAPEDGPSWGQVRRSARGTTISLGRRQDAFADWLVARMDELHARWAEDQNATDGKEG